MSSNLPTRQLRSPADLDDPDNPDDLDDPDDPDDPDLPTLVFAPLSLFFAPSFFYPLIFIAF